MREILFGRSQSKPKWRYSLLISLIRILEFQALANHIQTGTVSIVCHFPVVIDTVERVPLQK